VSIVVMIDGELRPPGAQHISVFDRAFLYGDSVFETLRTYRGVPFELHEHLARLARSASLVFIDLPVPLAELELELRRAIDAADNPESYIRLMVTRGQGALGLDPGLAERPTRVIIVQPLSPPAAHFYEAGVGAISYRTQRQVDATSAVGAKVGNYLVSVLAMREASHAGAVEALIVDARGCVLEGGSSNVFLVERGKLVTPDLSAGILAGITRAKVLQVAQGLGIALELRTPSLDEAYRADEVFISSSIRELMPVVRLDERPIGTGKPGPVFARLLAAFRALVGAAR
jgi:branched-chain amino acid aminotransferase